MLPGLPGGARAPARVPAEEHRDGEQEAEGPTGGVKEPGPAGKKGAGGRRPGAAGATVSAVDTRWCLGFYLTFLEVLQKSFFFVFYLHAHQDQLDSM